MAEMPVATGLSIGEKLEALRNSREMSVQELAQAVRLDTVVISQIERGVTTPPVGTLIKLASAFNVNVSYFFEDELSNRKVEVVRAEEHRRIQRNTSRPQSPLSYVYESLAFRKRDKKMEPFLIEFDIDVEEDIPPIKHGGEEFLYILEGQVEVQMGDERITLYQGDSIYFESKVPHAFVGRGHRKPKAIAVVYPGPAHPNDGEDKNST
jgi:transcriptional regulator with XRE-family HTH domain